MATRDLIITDKRLRDFTMNSFRTSGMDTKGFLLSGEHTTFFASKSLEEAEEEEAKIGGGRTSVLTNHKGVSMASSLIPPVFAPINQIGYPTITPKFLNRMD